MLSAGTLAEKKEFIPLRPFTNRNNVDKAPGKSNLLNSMEEGLGFLSGHCYSIKLCSLLRGSERSTFQVPMKLNLSN